MDNENCRGHNVIPHNVSHVAECKQTIVTIIFVKKVDRKRKVIMVIWEQDANGILTPIRMLEIWFFFGVQRLFSVKRGAETYKRRKEKTHRKLCNNTYI